MKIKFFPIVLLLVIMQISTASFAAELTRVYGNGKPTGSTPTNSLSSALASVGAFGRSSNGDAVWSDLNDGGPQQYSKSSIIASRTRVDDFLRSGRRGTSTLTGITSSALSSSIIYSY